MTLRIYIPGKAQPAGSKRAFPFRKANGKLGVRVSDDNPHARSWKGDVIVAAGQAMRDAGIDTLHGPLELHVTFVRSRPAGHFNSRGELNKKGLEELFPTTKPDTTKLLRCLEDALTEAGVWVDDARVVTQTACKRWGTSDATLVFVSRPFSKVVGPGQVEEDTQPSP